MGKYTREQMQQYQNDRRAALRLELRAILGSVCAWCGSQDDLHFDHINPLTKRFEIASGLDKPHDVLMEEVAKCQLLCKPCHIEKSRQDGPSPNRAQGERISSAKLTADDVRAIRASNLSSRKAASYYGVSHTQIMNIRAGKSWKHLI